MNAMSKIGVQDIEADPRWAAFVARDPEADGTFWIAVSSTGIYCRPSCSARRPNRENVSFHDTLEAARATGFRPCLRCHPDGASPRSRWVAEVCRRIDAAEAPLALDALSRIVGLSPSHLQRAFKAETGLSPRAYAAEVRARRLKDGLDGDTTVTQALYAAGFNSSGRLYDQSDALLGMTPGRYRKGGAGETLRYAIAPCTLGRVLVASTDKGVAAILLGDDDEGPPAELRRRFPGAKLVAGGGDYQAVLDAVVAVVDTPKVGFDLPLDIRGTAFQQRVWQALREIPLGETSTYGEIARRIGAPKAVRAVGAACGRNPVSVVVPCHRVLGGDGALHGYYWGLDRKRRLLGSEGVEVG
jgi:AraC family transcriptional regulator of adaptative response/methylated-DNA-[protein]-cysteine methyltransferase